jgi:dTDP-glucose 4,6-dehydratase
MTTILITGGAGFIGSNFVHFLCNNYPDYEIVVLDALTYAGCMENLPDAMRDLSDPKMRFWYGDVTNSDIVTDLVSKSDYVVHFAAETHVTRSIFDNKLFFQTDVLGTQAVSNAVLKADGRVKRFIHISTSEVYGSAEDIVMDEKHPLNPMSPYASAKCGADRLVYSYRATYGIPAVILRPFNNFGPRQHLEKVIPRFITSQMLGESLTVHGNGEASRDFVHVDDTCRAIDAVLHADSKFVDGEVFNIGSGSHRKIGSIAKDILGLMAGNVTQIEYTGERPGQVTRHTCDYSKIKRILGWEPQVTWEKGLAETIDWFKQNRLWWENQLWMRRIPITTVRGKKEYH